MKADEFFRGAPRCRDLFLRTALTKKDLEELVDIERGGNLSSLSLDEVEELLRQVNGEIAMRTR